MPELLSMQDVSVRRGLSRVLDRFSVSVNSGEVVLLKGENGCGKSTVVEAAAGLLTLDEGVIEHYGKVYRDHQGRRRKSRFGLTLQSQTSMSDELVFERVNSAGTSKEILSKWGLAHRSEDRIGTLSGGLRRRIDVLCGLIPAMVSSDSTLVILDEPEAGMDNETIELLKQNVDSLAASGHGILISTHSEILDEVADKIIEMGGESTTNEIKHSSQFNKLEKIHYSSIKLGLRLNLRTMSGFLHNGIVGLLVLGGILALVTPDEITNPLLTGLMMAPALAAGLAGDPISRLLDEGRTRDWWRVCSSIPTAIPHVFIGSMILTLISCAALSSPDWKIILAASAMSTITALYVNWLHQISCGLGRNATLGIKALTPIVILPWAIVVDLLV